MNRFEGNVKKYLQMKGDLSGNEEQREEKASIDLLHPVHCKPIDFDLLWRKEIRCCP